MVARARGTSVSGDKFVDWLFKLTGEVRQEMGLSEKKSAEVVSFLVGRVQREWGGQTPYVHSQLKSSSILQRWKDGWAVQKIAADLDASEDYVRKVINNRGI